MAGIFMELVKRQIHMNRWKGNVTTQITLDEDFIVPDTLDDMVRVMLSTGDIQIESVKNQGDKAIVKGKLEFQVLYGRESGGLQTLGGQIPFEESINVSDLEEKDYVGIGWLSIVRGIAQCDIFSMLPPRACYFKQEYLKLV